MLEISHLVVAGLALWTPLGEFHEMHWLESSLVLTCGGHIVAHWTHVMVKKVKGWRGA